MARRTFLSVALCQLNLLEFIKQYALLVGRTEEIFAIVLFPGCSNKTVIKLEKYQDCIDNDYRPFVLWATAEHVRLGWLFNLLAGCVVLL